MRRQITVLTLMAVLAQAAGCAGDRQLARAGGSGPEGDRACTGVGEVESGHEAEAPDTSATDTPADGEETVLVEFFVMSKCPFAARVEKTIAPVLAKFGDSVEFRLEYIGTEKDGQLTALHGPDEVRGDTIQLCAARAYPSRYLELVLCMNQNQRAIPEGWRHCAAKLGMSVEPILACADSQDGKVLVRGSYMRSKERKALGSPTMFFNKKPYRGPRSELALTRRICNTFEGTRPAACSDIPQPMAVEVTIISDERCKECKYDAIKTRLESLLPGARFTVVDYLSAAGQKLYGELGPGPILLPAVVFGPQVVHTESWERLSRMVLPAGEHRLMRYAGRFDPTREICDNGVDDTGNGKVDCQDPDCIHAIACRPEERAKLEIFVMSQCPYAVRALNALKQVLKEFKGDIRVELHYIAESRGDGFRALHGQPEVEENIRQLCAMKYYPEGYKFMDYIWCRNENIRSEDWRACTGANGIDAEVIARCARGQEGASLLRTDIEVAEGLDVKASPTWFVNGRHKFNGIDARVITENFCAHNEELAPCQGGD